MQTKLKNPIRTLLAAMALLSFGSSCAATVNGDQTKLMPMKASVRVDPPSAGQNNVYVDFRDLTGEPGLEDEIFDRLLDAVAARGWKLSDDFHSADYVLWADLRLFAEAGTEEGDAALNRLGGIAAGAAAGIATAKVTDNWWYGAAAGGLAGAATDVILRNLTREQNWQMVMDLVLGRKIDGGVETIKSSDDKATTGSAVAAGSSVGGEVGFSESKTESSQTINETRVHYELEQRLVALAGGRRCTKEMAKNELVPRIVDGLKSQLPRVR